MALLSSLHPYIMPELPNCPSQIVNRVIVDSVREFCRRSKILRRSESFSIVVGQSEYVLPPLSDTQVLEIERVSMGNDDIPLYTEFSGIVKLSETDEGEMITYYRWAKENTVKVYPIPNVLMNEILDIDYSYQIARDATEIPDEIFDRWSECIAAKVKYMMMMQANKPWSNPQYAVVNKVEWYRLLGDALSEANRRYGNPVSAAFYSLDQG